MADPRPNLFGLLLRGSRLGYRQVAQLPGRPWLRVDAGGPPHRVSLATTAREMAEQSSGRGSAKLEYVCWWEGDPGAVAMLSASPALRELTEERLPCVLLLDDEGLEVADG